MKKSIFTGFLFSLACIYMSAQVKGPDRIIGEYNGGQKKELANGKGKSVGTDTYEGEFKKGYPEGLGIYIFGEDTKIGDIKFSKGDCYKGNFSKGTFDGKGKIVFADQSKGELAGYWERNDYIGTTPTGYQIVRQENIVRVVIQKNGTANNKIAISGLDQIVLTGEKYVEFDGVSNFTDIPSSKFPFRLSIKGSVPSTGAKAELQVIIERPGNWTIKIETNSMDDSNKL